MKPEEQWLLALADIAYTNGAWPPPLSVRGVDLVCQWANLHSVLPPVLQGIERLLREAPATLLLNPQEIPQALKVIAPIKNRLAERAAMAMFLSVEAKRLIAELAVANCDAIILKGIDFATRLYAHPGLRTFGDMDLLIRANDWDRVSALMERLGYQPLETTMKYAEGYGERSWQNPAMPGATVEIHDNLVNSPSIQRGVSVRFDDLPLERIADGKWRATPAGLLIIAAVHAATGHSFEKLQHLSDIAQIARGRAGAIDESALRECAIKTGAAFSVAAALHLVARTFKDSSSAELLARLKLPRPAWWFRWLMTPTFAVRSQGHGRQGTSWRRRMLRQMLKNRR